jgi:hypothetical protein
MKKVRDAIAKAVEMLTIEGRRKGKTEFTVEEIWQCVHAL